MKEKRVYEIMDKWGKLSGTLKNPFFSDRQFAIEILFDDKQKQDSE